MSVAEPESRRSPFPPDDTLTACLLPFVRDLGAHRPSVYWSDFLLSIGFFWGSWAALAIHGPTLHLHSVLLFAVAVLALYRASCFMHEIVHVPEKVLPGFRLVWDLLCGLPLLMPSFLYRSHIDHHGSRTYGTPQDPEYLPRLHTSLQGQTMLLVGTLLAPLGLWLRFAFLAPLAWCVPALRRLVDIRCSSVALHPAYRAQALRLRKVLWHSRVMEVLTSVWAWGFTVGIASGVIPPYWASSFLAVVLCVLLVNMTRTAFTHRYRHSGEPMTHAEQIADSVTWGGGGFLVELFAPVGLRYHALHHLFPYLPYHALSTAHARLMTVGPVAFPYLETDRTSAKVLTVKAEP